MRLEEDKGYLICDYCEATYAPDPNDRGIRVLGERTTLSCSICSIQLVHAAVSGQIVLYCEECRGILIGMDLFATLIQTLRWRGSFPIETIRPPDWKGLHRKMDCPRCRNLMNTHLYGGPGNIVMDNCEHCSVNWLDDGELQRIVGAPDRQYESREPAGEVNP
jgi:Zn-finger nucleic acid-binding protein